MKNTIRSVAVVLVIIICFSMCGCSIFDTDDMPAVVEMTTESGQAILTTSWNGLGRTASGSRLAVKNGYMVVLQDEDDTLNVHFYCEACGHDEECELNAPASKMFECDCPTDGDDNNNAKEFFALVVTTESNIETTETTE